MKKETYKAYITATKNGITKKRVLTGISASKKANAVRKGLYNGYQIKSEGMYFIVLEKDDNGVKKHVGMFIE